MLILINLMFQTWRSRRLYQTLISMLSVMVLKMEMSVRTYRLFLTTVTIILMIIIEWSPRQRNKWLRPSDDVNIIEVHNGNSNADEVDYSRSTPPLETSRYLPQNRNGPKIGYMASAATSSEKVVITTSEEPTLKEAVFATLEERDFWVSVIDEGFQSLYGNGTSETNNTNRSQPLPTHVVLKLTHNFDGSVKCVKAFMAGNGNFQDFGKNFCKQYEITSKYVVRSCIFNMTIILNISRSDWDKLFWTFEFWHLLPYIESRPILHVINEKKSSANSDSWLILCRLVVC